MWRTWVCLVVGCVLGLGPAASGSLVGWWTLDEGSGTVAGDSSGNGLDGTFVGNPQWVPGMRGGALWFDGSSAVDLAFSPKTNLTATFSIACWVKPDKLGAIVTQDRGFFARDGAYVFKASGNKVRLTTPGVKDHTTANGTLQTGTWQHVAITFQAGQAGGAIFYLNGVETDRIDASTIPVGSSGPARIANNQYSNQFFLGALDDMRLYDHVLSANEVKQLALRPQAWEPNPADGAAGVTMGVLQWKGGGAGLVYNVYVGTSPELTAADLSGSNLLQPLHFYAGLQPGLRYYWRVDEIEADLTTVHQGSVWSFSTAPRQAWAPQPFDGARYVDPQAQLSWSLGAGAMTHDLYFSTDRAAVEAGAESARIDPRPAQPSYAPAGLVRGAEYFWRVDEEGPAGKTPGAVWSFSTQPVIAPTDPNLVGWWKMNDEHSGTAVDSSGRDNYGTIQGPLWADGYLGDALAFDGVDDGVDCGTDASINNVTSVTVAAWVKLAGLGVDRKIASNQNNSSGGYKLGVYSTNKVEMEMRTSANSSTNGLNRSVAGGTVFEKDVWYHVAGVYSNGKFIRTYVNGRLDRELVTSNVIGVSTGPLRLGREAYSTAYWWWGLLDDVRVYNKALTEEEIAAIMQGDPLQASQPQPGHGANADIRAATELSWSAGATAAQHDVYFGSDKDAVKAADTASPEYQGRQVGTSFSLDGLTAFGGGKYSWRIDEVEADGTTIHQGNLWQFNVPGLLIVDDFESYNDEENQGTRLYETWIDGYSDSSSGSTVGNLNPPFAERTIVHGGKQSTPMDYNNINAPFYSQAYREFSPAENWTANGVANLSLWFRGHPQKMVETAPGHYIISSTSGDISGTADNFRFVCKRLDGDGTIQAQVLGVTYTAPWAKAGVMINESLEPSSARGHMIITPSGRRAFENRPVAGAASFSAYSATGLITPPYWVKLERKGNQITAYHSPDGVNWILQPDNENTSATTRSPNPQTFNMANTVYIGLLVTSNNLNAPCFGAFSDVTVTGTVSGDWRIVDIGPNRGNDPGVLYVALEDGNGKLATLKNGQAGAVNTLTWTEWQIPLADFAGVNLNKVKKLWIGVGDQAATTPDGTGRIYIDDICLTTP